jgi:acylphosphatase
MAEQLGVAGWVRNLPSGDVEAVFEGSSATVAGAVEWCRRGPERAVVTSLQEIAEKPEALTNFSIR